MAETSKFGLNGDLIAPPPIKIHEASQNHVPHIHIPRFSLLNKIRVLLLIAKS